MQHLHEAIQDAFDFYDDHLYADNHGRAMPTGAEGTTVIGSKGETPEQYPDYEDDIEC
jgi:hypothetical protein